MLPSLREQHLSGGRAVNGCEVLPAQPSQLADVIVCDVKVLKVLERERKWKRSRIQRLFFFVCF